MFAPRRGAGFGHAFSCRFNALQRTSKSLSEPTTRLHVPATRTGTQPRRQPPGKPRKPLLYSHLKPSRATPHPSLARPGTAPGPRFPPIRADKRRGRPLPRNPLFPSPIRPLPATTSHVRPRAGCCADACRGRASPGGQARRKVRRDGTRAGRGSAPQADATVTDRRYSLGGTTPLAMKNREKLAWLEKPKSSPISLTASCVPASRLIARSIRRAFR